MIKNWKLDSIFAVTYVIFPWLFCKRGHYFWEYQIFSCSSNLHTTSSGQLGLFLCLFSLNYLRLSMIVFSDLLADEDQIHYFLTNVFIFTFFDSSSCCLPRKCAFGWSFTLILDELITPTELGLSFQFSY